MIPNNPFTRWLTGLLGIFVFGAFVGHTLYPRIVETIVSRDIIKNVPVPGETKTVYVNVPGPVQKVEVPVVIERPGPERVVTITQPVPVPVEVIKDKWPQTITVSVGSVLSDKDEWVVPKAPDLIIGMVEPGVYAVSSEQVGWKVERVGTSSILPQIQEPSWRFTVRPTVGVIAVGPTLALGTGLQVTAGKDHWVLEFAGGVSTQGNWGVLLASYSF